MSRLDTKGVVSAIDRVGNICVFTLPNPPSLSPILIIKGSSWLSNNSAEPPELPPKFAKSLKEATVVTSYFLFPGKNC